MVSCLLGSKSFAICSQHANVLVVVAEKSDELKQQYEIDEDDDTDDDDYFDAYMAIVLDPKSSGITIIDEIKTIGCNDVPFKSIHFSNVRIGKDQILSEGIDDRKTSQKLIASARLQESTLNMIQAKNLLNRLTEFCIKTVCNSEKMRYIGTIISFDQLKSNSHNVTNLFEGIWCMFETILRNWLVKYTD